VFLDSVALLIGKKAEDVISDRMFYNMKREDIYDEDDDIKPHGYSFHENGIDINIDDKGDVVAIFLSQKHIRSTEIYGITSNISRTFLINNIGNPVKTGGKFIDDILGEFGPWDRFEYGEFCLHAEYDVDGEIVKTLTLMDKSVVP